MKPEFCGLGPLSDKSVSQDLGVTVGLIAPHLNRGSVQTLTESYRPEFPTAEFISLNSRLEQATLWHNPVHGQED
jgi:hypothetical protein